MKKTSVPLSTALLLSLLAGCHADSTKAPILEPKAATSQHPTNQDPDPSNEDCAAIKDAAQAENCRLWKGIAAAKKKHNSDPVVKHKPGSLQQP